MRALHLTTHLNTGGITSYIRRLVLPLRARGVEIMVASSGGSCAAQFHELNVETHNSIPRTKSVLDPRLYLALPGLTELIRKKKIDLLHAHTRVTQVQAFFLHRLTGVPVVTTCHGYFKRRLGRKILPAWGQAVIAISEPVAERLRTEFKVPESCVKKIDNGIDLPELDKNFDSHDPAKSKVSFGFDPDSFVIGSMARLVKDKGHEYLIRAFALMKGDFPKMRLLIVGDGKYRLALESLVRELELDEQVVFTGSVDDIARPLAAMDCFVFPATWKEGFGLSLMEAMACRIPVVATRIWALDQILEDETTALLIEPKSIEGIIRAVVRIIQDKALRQRLKNQGRKMIEQRFSLEYMADRVAQIYQYRMERAKPDVTPLKSQS